MSRQIKADRDTLNYIESMLKELAKLARQSKGALLPYLIDVAAEEARDMRRTMPLAAHQAAYNIKPVSAQSDCRDNAKADLQDPAQAG